MMRYLVIILILLSGCREEEDPAATPEVQPITPGGTVASTQLSRALALWMPARVVLPGWDEETPATQIAAAEQIWFGQVEDCFDHVDFSSEFDGTDGDACLDRFGAGIINENAANDQLCLRRIADDDMTDLVAASQFGLGVVQGAFCALLQTGVHPGIPQSGEETLLSDVFSSISTNADVADFRFVLSREQDDAGIDWYVTQLSADDAASPAWAVTLRRNSSGGVLWGQMADRHSSGKHVYFSWEFQTTDVNQVLSSGHMVSEIRFAAMNPEANPFTATGRLNLNTGAVFDEPDSVAFGSYENDAEGLVVEDITRLISHLDYAAASHYATLWSNQTGYYFENAFVIAVNHDFSTSKGCLVAGVPSREEFGVSIRRSIRENDLGHLPAGSETRDDGRQFSTNVTVQCHTLMDGAFVSDAEQITDGYLVTDYSHVTVTEPRPPAVGGVR